MKLKLTRRLFAAVLTLALSVGLLDTSTLAAGVVNNVKEKTGGNGSIVVTVYNNTPSVSAGTGAATTVSDADPVNGVGINALRIGSVVELTSTDNGTVSTQVAFGLTETYATLLGLDTDNAIARQTDSGGSTTTYYFEPAAVQDKLKRAMQANIEEYLDDNQNGATNKVTGDDGVATFDNLPYGLYLLAKSSLPADATTDLVPFLVSVPMYVESTSGDAWQSTVYAYPKVRTADITISKTVDDEDGKDYTNDKYVNAGQTLQYTVTTTIPASQSATGTGSANQFTSFMITDTNAGSTLDIDTTSVEVKLNNTVLTKETQYTVSYTGTDSVLTITLTDPETTGGLATLNNDLSQEQTITVTYDATVATDVSFFTKLTNTAKATYQREGMTATADTNTVTVDLFTYGIDLTKTLSDRGNITENTISFELYKDNQGQLGDKIPVTSATGGESGYWVAANEETSSVVMYVDTYGKLNLYGLEPGTYYLKETTTMKGYTLLDKPITIVITDEDNDGTATATVNGAIAQVANGVVPLSVENTKNQAGFTLPQTGGAGTLLATAIGLGLLCAAVILLVVYRKKGRKNT